MTVITCSQLSYCPKFSVFRSIQPEKSFDRWNYSNHDFIKAESRTRRGPGSGPSWSMPLENPDMRAIGDGPRNPHLFNFPHLCNRRTLIWTDKLASVTQHGGH
ncbi:hypothetical protein TNCV_2481801 [Trichonephila clavipes]|nr:hypothetical protein TNCV_2481801 [Trichonephila clavipes]